MFNHFDTIFVTVLHVMQTEQVVNTCNFQPLYADRWIASPQSQYLMEPENGAADRVELGWLANQRYSVQSYLSSYSLWALSSSKG